MRIVFLGPPGSGKGTQAGFVEERYGVCRVATGEILRRAARAGSPLGRKTKDYLAQGRLVPDDIMVELVAERLREQDCGRGFILDGFPRTVAQADGLEAILKDLDSELDCVFSLEVPYDVIVQRLAGRRTCAKCGAMCHLVFSPPGREDLCDRCGGNLYQREDDREETVRERLRVYGAETEPLVEYYRRKGLLRVVDGLGSIEEVRSRIFEKLERVGA